MGGQRADGRVGGRGGLSDAPPGRSKPDLAPPVGKTQGPVGDAILLGSKMVLPPGDAALPGAAAAWPARNAAGGRVGGGVDGLCAERAKRVG